MNLFDDLLGFWPMNEPSGPTTVNGVTAHCHSIVNDAQIGATIVNPDGGYPIALGAGCDWGAPSGLGKAVSFTGNSKSAAGDYLGFPAATVSLCAKNNPMFAPRRGLSASAWIKPNVLPTGNTIQSIVCDYVLADLVSWVFGVSSTNKLVLSFYAPNLTLAGTLTGASGVWVESTKTLTVSGAGWTAHQLKGTVFTIFASRFVCADNTATTATMTTDGSLSDRTTNWTVNLEVAYESTANLSSGSSYAVAFAWDGTTTSTAYSLYINGVLDSQFSAAGGATIAIGTGAGINNNLPSIGGFTDGTGTLFVPFSGVGGMVGLWSRGIIATEVAGLANKKNPIPQKLTYALGGFNPGKTNPSWFSAAPAKGDIALLNAMWRASPLQTITDPSVMRVWDAIYLLGYGGIDNSGTLIPVSVSGMEETILQAMDQIALAGYGQASGNRTALLVPNGTHAFNASIDTLNATCPYGLIDMQNCPCLDIIGQSRTGTFINSNRPGSFGLYSFNDNFPIILARGSSIFAHFTTQRIAPPATSVQAQISVNTTGGVVNTGSVSVTRGGDHYEVETYAATDGSGHFCYVTVTQVDGSGAVQTARIDPGAGMGGTGFSAGPITLTLSANASHYNVHDEPGFVGATPGTNVYYDIEGLNQYAPQWLGADISSGSSFYFCCDSDATYNCHGFSETLALTVMWNNCSVGINPFTGSRNNATGVPTSGVDWNFGLVTTSAQADQITMIGCRFQGTTYDINFNDTNGFEYLYTDGNQRSGYIDPSTGAGDAYPSANSITGTAGQIISGMGGIVVVVDPPIHASAMFAQEDPAYIPDQSNSLLTGVTVDDVSGAAVGSVDDLPTPDEVLLGVDRGDGVLGTLVVPNTTDVRQGVEVGTTYGQVYVPNTTQVLWGVQVDVAGVGSLGSVQLSALQPINPSTGAMTLTIGDDYKAADGRAITFTDPLNGTWPAAINTARLTVRQNGNNASTQINVTTNSIAGNPRVISFSIGNTVTTNCAPSQTAWDNSYCLTCYTVSNTNDVVTLYNEMPATIVEPLTETPFTAGTIDF